ncbi:MAG: alanine racemase [Gemmatimonadota bacterium]|nr:MAG: alanine racemase [Gemmatimonadota bacterium]
MKRQDLDTPALIVDAVTMNRNIERMQRAAVDFGVRLRPHTKTHKSPEIAKLQVAAGAAGITVAKLGEAQVMADAGLDDILIANQIVGPLKLRRLAELAGRVRLAVLVDSREGVLQLEQALGEAGNVAVDVLIEVDTGKGRCGLGDLEGIADLADRIERSAVLRLRGVETHEGHVPAGAGSADQMRERAETAGRRVEEIAVALRARGHDVPEVSVGSTPAAPWTARISGITEMRPGTYVFNDVNQIAIAQATPADCALSVLASVISRPAPDRAVLDAGSKSLFCEPARRGFALIEYDGFGYIREAPAARIVGLNEEHAIVRLPAGSEFPGIGERVEVIPNHVCPAVNLHDELALVDGDEVVEIWPIAARGKVR